MQPEDRAGFSATAYFFGRELHKQLNVPVGLIDSRGAARPSRLGPAEGPEAVPD